MSYWKECQMCGEPVSVMHSKLIHSSCINALQNQVVSLAEELGKLQLRVAELEKALAFSAPIR